MLTLIQRDCNIYAIKALKSSDKRAFDQEAKILQKLSHERHVHPNLITLLATYKYSGTYHLVFPWAETDLFGYWKLFPGPQKDEATGTWLVEQSRGLAEGLYTIHRYQTVSGSSLLNVFGPATGQRSQESLRVVVRRESAGTPHVNNFYGRHGDLKPENILWFPDPSGNSHGVLKITDFGIARFKTEDRWSGRPPNSLTYRSPEIDLDRKLSTACDVWALGCVYLEFITWYFGGQSYLEYFGRKRLAPDQRCATIPTDTFFTIYEESGVKKAKVKDAVVQMVEELHEHQCCTEDFRVFLEIIRRDMLVVHQPNPPHQEVENLMLLGSIPGSLSVPGQDSLRRKSCGEIHRLLGDIKPRRDQESVCTRHSTMESTSPLTQSHFNLPLPDRTVSPTPSPRVPPGRRRSSGLSFFKQAATANGRSSARNSRTHEDVQENTTPSEGMIQAPP
jgi:serine/threonine protein kinase